MRGILLAVLVGWVGLVAYLAAFTSPPIEAILLFLIPVFPFVWLLVISNRPRIWQVDTEAIERIEGNHIRQRIRLDSIQSVTASGSKEQGMVRLFVQGHGGRNRLSLMSDSVIGVDDVRFLYQAIAYHVSARGIKATNTLEWQSNLPEQETRTVKGPGMKSEVVAQFLIAGPMIMFVVGVLLAGFSAWIGNWPGTAVFAGLSVCGGALILVVYRTIRNWPVFSERG